MAEECGTCIYYRGQWGGYPDSCHRHAPVVNVNAYLGTWDGAKQYGPMPAWPKVSNRDSCGDWSPLPNDISGDQ